MDQPVAFEFIYSIQISSPVELAKMKRQSEHPISGLAQPPLGNYCHLGTLGGRVQIAPAEASFETITLVAAKLVQTG